MSTGKNKSIADVFGRLFKNQIFIPLAAMFILLLFNLIRIRDFSRSQWVITVRVILYYQDIL